MRSGCGTKEQQKKKNLVRGGKTRIMHATPEANLLLDTYMFYVSSFKPAQDPWQLIHSGKGGAFNPHGLQHGCKGMEGRKEEKSLVKHW